MNKAVVAEGAESAVGVASEGAVDKGAEVLVAAAESVDKGELAALEAEVLVAAVKVAADVVAR